MKSAENQQLSRITIDNVRYRASVQTARVSRRWPPLGTLCECVSCMVIRSYQQA